MNEKDKLRRCRLSTRKLLPLWLVGVTNATFGMYGGFVAMSVPQLLADQHMPLDKIVSVTSLLFSAYVWSFFLGPFLDVWMSRRSWAFTTALVAGVSLTVALLNLQRPAVLEVAAIVGVVAVYLSSSALFGWLSSIVPAERENQLSAWLSVCNIGAAGLYIIVQSEVAHRFSPTIAAVVMGGVLVLPTLIFPFLPTPPPQLKLAKESFADFHRDLVQLLRRPQVLLALGLFAAPTASFALSNIFGGVGDEYHASSQLVGWVGGTGVLIGGSLASLVVPQLARLFPLRPLYLGIGIVGALFTLSLLLLPHVPAVFAVALIGEGAFQAMAMTTAVAIQFETVGKGNPLASSGFAFMGAAVNLSIAYMMAVDGWAAGLKGLKGSILSDGLISIVACALMFPVVLLVMRGKSRA